MERGAITQKILEFLDANELGILSTIHVDKNAPESAVVGFGNTRDLEIIFGTDRNTRKYRNLQKNGHVSMVIGWSSITGSLQYEGVARELTDEELRSYAELLIRKNESHRQFIGLSTQRYFIIRATWIRFYDNAGSPPDVYELEGFRDTQDGIDVSRFPSNRPL